ncbi:MAG TPA: SagB/ThcOx family dehydrogenase [Nitrososphaeraceae archaeon]|nr:SagB/ThcOx family dehydrogenase [Nitrososphaeraceae archaeon]
MNKNIKYALDYHESTKHSEISLMTSRHYLDLDNRPLPFKVYTELLSYPLPLDFSQHTLNAITSISRIYPQTSENAAPDITRTNLNTKSLAEILFFSGGITREIKYPLSTYYMRAASATGALYPIELYIVCQDLADLKAGVYHFDPADFRLTQIRTGDYRSELAAAAGDNKSIITSPITIIFTSIAWRNAWKYQARSYRHWFWDSGVIAANLLATTVSMGLPTRLIIGFVDDKISQLLCLEDHREEAVVMAAIGIGLSKDLLPKEDKLIPYLPIPKIRPLSKKGETDYPEIWILNDSSKLFSKEEVKEWINEDNPSIIPVYKQSSALAEILDRQPLSRDQYNSSNVPNLCEVILRRGSSRRFSRSSVSFSVLSTILQSSTRGVPLDIFKENGDSLIDIYLIANDINGITPGGYFFNRNSQSLEQLKRNVSRNMSGYLCLGQSLFSDASAVFFLMTDLQSVLKSLGNRGYRASQFEAGVIAGKIYLAAYAQQIGASGSTFFDDAVTEFFSPHASNKSTMIVVGIGVPAYKANPGKILPPRLTKEQLLTENL